MPVPFIRRMPSGDRVLNEIARDPAIELQAAEFIDHAGRYLIELIPAHKVCEDINDPAGKMQVHLMAIIDKAEGCVKVADELCDNGPELLNAVDRLVTESVKHIPIRLFVPANKNLELVK